ncbi:glutathione peroxidase [Catellatospora sp. IY07-71]|uniref:glutathione peroxidase n=1 Tax=Catellatospora sp. IY07-71 TaxID=2728827 RepID=UPI001BB38E0C|nr:glutathione peroxidase [Catellatospora sp. IY07-71]
MSIYDVQIKTLQGADADLAQYRGKAVLIVNVASRCGLTPQYTGLQKLAETYGEQGLTVLGVPCNQFGGQEPGSAAEIAEFCDVNYGVTFPLTEKIEVNGAGRHPLYDLLTQTPDADGKAGDVTWNFEKFLVDRSGAVTRLRPQVTPESAELTGAVERALA